MELEASMDLIDRDKIRNYGHHVHHQVAMFFFSKCQLAYVWFYQDWLIYKQIALLNFVIT